MAARRVARVLIDSPLPQLDRLFDYAVPESLHADAIPGVRVKVPLRSAGRMIEGFIVDLSDEDAADRPLSEVDAVVSTVPVLTPALYALVRKAADRAAGSASDILRLAIPKRMVRAEKQWLAAGDPDTPTVDAAAADWARQSVDMFPGLAEAIAAGERVAVTAVPNPVIVTGDGQPATVGAWAELLAAAAVATLAAGRSTILSC